MRIQNITLKPYKLRFCITARSVLFGFWDENNFWSGTCEVINYKQVQENDKYSKSIHNNVCGGVCVTLYCAYISNNAYRVATLVHMTIESITRSPVQVLYTVSSARVVQSIHTLISLGPHAFQSNCVSRAVLVWLELQLVQPTAASYCQFAFDGFAAVLLVVPRPFQSSSFGLL